ncbi:hypothetical protein [Sphingomonas sp. VDB2]|uniref:hypothetical protein n=1 Tax=Sphingomonas sp. VDB2 TaxID=3228751 RepID=UPI003A80E321
MTRDELIEIMMLEGIPQGMLCSQTSIPSECFVIREMYGVWETFYAERGLETGLVTHPTEDAACRTLLEELRGYAAASGIVKRNGN